MITCVDGAIQNPWLQVDLRSMLPVPGEVTEIVITDDGTRMYAAVSGARTIHVVDLVSMTLKSTMTLPGSQVSLGMFTLPDRPDSLLVTTWDLGSRQPGFRYQRVDNRGSDASAESPSVL